MRERRRKSIHATLHAQEVDRPIKHLPGWTTHRTRVTDVNIPIESGWSRVTIERLSILKSIVNDATDEYMTRVACDKVKKINIKAVHNIMYV